MRIKECNNNYTVAGILYSVEHADEFRQDREPSCTDSLISIVDATLCIEQAKLSIKQQEALLLVYKYGFSTHEAARILSISHVGVIDRCNTAKRKIQQVLNSWYKQEGENNIN
ncbi:hypothetical protein [Candidatus Enterococcus clewellii]|uniref:RNA polymerase sigma factor 70 region 4 type 2 domain-containing protein n=1 Tax=Candidatus Enterococcus clewellii TaxID=1834193 RepID=A0A242KCR0_9ENTE|nr:hypothetical protein [Enterococcus sp. 9E7_DIV0242]OTP18746.1 hypothetical protein A5888_000560 [Enterococcus sp. 9E7_DIV0242]